MNFYETNSIKIKEYREILPYARDLNRRTLLYLSNEYQDELDFRRWIYFFNVIEEDGYYYTRYSLNDFCNKFGSLKDLSDYLFINYYSYIESKVLDRIKKTKIDLSTDENSIFSTALKNDHISLIKFLINDYRVREKLTAEEIEKYSNHIKESYSIEWNEYPTYGQDLSERERSILEEFVGDDLNCIIKDDGYYYTRLRGHTNRFDKFEDLMDYIFLSYIMDVECSYFEGKKYKNDPKKFLEILQNTKLDMSFDNNWPIEWACRYGHVEIVKKLLDDRNVDPCVKNNKPIESAYDNGHPEIVKILLDDPRVYYTLEEHEPYLLLDYYEYLAYYGYYI